MMPNTDNLSHPPLISLRSNCFKKSKQTEQNCERVQKIRSTRRAGPLLPSCSPPPLFSPFFSHSRRAPSLASLLAHLFDLSAWKRKGRSATATQAIFSININVFFFSRAHRQKIKLKFIIIILHVTDFKCFVFFQLRN